MNAALTRGSGLPVASPIAWRRGQRRTWQHQSDWSLRARTVLQPCCDHFHRGGADAVDVDHADEGTDAASPPILPGGASAMAVRGCYPVECAIRSLPLSVSTYFPARTDEGGTENEGGPS